MDGGVAFGSRYVLGEVLGRGAMGRVFRASVRGTGASVAVKVLRDDLSSQPDVVARFVQERQVLRSVNHPNVVRVHDLVVEGDQLGIVMDLVEGGDLRTGVRFPVPADQALSMVRQIASGLAAVHAAGVIHRDLKPENVLVDRRDGQMVLRLTDFGVSRLVGQTLTKVTSLIGTPGYLAPEVADGQRPTAKADVYALGVLFFEMLTGRSPFEVENVMALMRAHAESPVPRPIGMPEDLWALLVGMLAKTPEGRLSTDAILARVGPLIASVGPAGPFDVVDEVQTNVGGAAASAATVMRTTPSDFAVSPQRSVTIQRFDSSGVDGAARQHFGEGNVVGVNVKNGGRASVVAAICVIAAILVGLVIAWQSSGSDSTGDGSATSTQTNPSTTASTTTHEATTTSQAIPALVLSAPTALSLAVGTCTSGSPSTCLLYLSWTDRSLGETAYQAEIDGYNGRTTVTGPPVDGSGERKTGKPVPAAVGYRFCITLFAATASDRSPGSAPLCATVQADGSLTVG